MDLSIILRKNLKTLLMRAASDGLRPDQPRDPEELETISGVGKSTIYDILDSTKSRRVQLATLDAIAGSYKLSAWMLLLPELPSVGKMTASSEEEIAKEIKERALQLFETALEQQANEARSKNSRAVRGSAAHGTTASAAKRPEAGRPRRLTPPPPPAI